MKIALLLIGSTGEDYLKEGVTEYAKRIKNYAGFEEILIPEEKKWRKLSPDERKRAEGEALRKKLSSGDILILLDENGREFTSVGFADYLQKKMNAGPKRLIFAVGGAFGFDEETYRIAQGKVALSQMTFSHQMVRLFALEQIYRAFTILNNEPYHNQ